MICRWKHLTEVAESAETGVLATQYSFLGLTGTSHSTMSAKENEPQVEIQAEEQQTAGDRVAGLPLVSSACEMASASYTATKETHPAIKGVCEVVETGERAITSAAINGAQPILAQLEPQLVVSVAAANEYACRGLDRLEEQLSILQQPIEKVALDAQDLMCATMVGAKDAVCSTVTEAKDAVTSMVSVAQGAVQESVEATKSAVTSSMSTVMGSSMGQMAASGIDTALGKSEQLVDYYLPMTEEELAELATTPLEGPGEAPAEQRSYYVRLGSLSSTLRQRAYQHALGKMRQARQRTLEALSQLQQIIDLISHAKQAVDQKLHNGQDRLYQMWLQYCRGKLEGQEDPDSAKVEAQVLAMSQSLTQQLKTTCLTLLGSIQGLPSTIQDKAQQVSSSTEELQASFSSACSFQDLSSSALARGREMVTKAQKSLDELLEYVTQNIPLDWIVGPFTPAGDSPQCPDELVEEGKKVEA
ncbi:perilipin-3-like [Caretta caretta]|uniref:perilipin-3-like n=1 Tax=Caretta caretta TaxID=8467 RepID=UPI003F4B2CF6